MINRVFLIVIEGLGAGAAADAVEYGDASAHTLAHLAESVGGLNLPTLESLGLGHVTEVSGVRSMGQPLGCFGRLGFKSKDLDSLAGYWEIAGCISDSEATSSADASVPMVRIVEQVFGRKVLGGQPSSRAASSTSLGISSKNDFIIHTTRTRLKLACARMTATPRSSMPSR